VLFCPVRLLSPPVRSERLTVQSEGASGRASVRARGRAAAGALLLLVTALLVVAAGVAHASRADASTCGTPQQRVNRALDSLHFPWRLLHYRYAAMSPRADDLLALTWTGTIRRTEVYVQACGQETDALLRHVLAHEVGHAIDDEWGSKQERKTWLKARRLAASTPWYACDGCPVWKTGEGDFVEVFSLWQTGQFRGQLAQPPTKAQLGRLVRLIPRHRPLLKPVSRPAASDPGAGTITVTGSSPTPSPAPTTPPPSYTYAPEPPAPTPPAPTPSTPAGSCTYFFYVPICR
jgi:hypothetical protein